MHPKSFSAKYSHTHTHDTAADWLRDLYEYVKSTYRYPSLTHNCDVFCTEAGYVRTCVIFSDAGNIRTVRVRYFAVRWPYYNYYGENKPYVSYLQAKVHKSQHWMCEWFKWLILQNVIAIYCTHNVRVRYSGVDMTQNCCWQRLSVSESFLKVDGRWDVLGIMPGACCG